MPAAMCGEQSIVTGTGEIVFDLADVERRIAKQRHAAWSALHVDLVAMHVQRHELIKRVLAKQIAMDDLVIAMDVIDDEHGRVNAE